MNLHEQLANTKVYDLAQTYYVGMPHFPTHPPFLFSLTKKHGEFTNPNGSSSAAESIALSGHTGTHIDALNHFSCNGFLFNGRAIEEAQSYSAGVQYSSVDTIAPIVRRGVLLDIAGLMKLDALEHDTAITPTLLDQAVATQRVEIREGDIVLLRTGWARYFSDAARYVNQTRCPGPVLEGAQWLSSRKIFAAGSDTIPFERIPEPNMPVHVHLLVESGIHIIEVLNLEELARDRTYEFLFIAAPLKLRGGTGAPVRPLAFPLETGYEL
jgi:kynurenine formamidase